MYDMRNIYEIQKFCHFFFKERAIRYIVTSESIGRPNNKNRNNNNTCTISPFQMKMLYLKTLRHMAHIVDGFVKK